MSTQQENVKQPENYQQPLLDDEERDALVQPFISTFNAEATECFADFLITLIDETHRRPSDARRLEGELIAALERTFRHSRAYELALDLYKSRFAFVPGRVSIIGRNLEEMLAEIQRNRVTERKAAAPAEWAMEFGSTVGRLLKNDQLSEVSYISLRDAVVELVSNDDHSIGKFGLALLPYVLTRFFARMPAPRIIVLITAADARSPKEPIEMGRLTKGDVWEDFEKLVTDLDKLLPSSDEELYHPLTIALEREDGARYIVYRREVGNSLVERAFDYAVEHLEVETTIRRAPSPQAENAVTHGTDAQSAVIDAPAGESAAQAAAPSNWIDNLGRVIAEALESGELPNETQTALENFVVNITDEHASGYADQARHLLALGLRRIIAADGSGEYDDEDTDADAEDGEDSDADADDSNDSQDEEPQTKMLFNLCDYTDLKLDFLLSEGGDKVFSFSLHRDPSTREAGRGLADVCFYTFGEKDSSFMYEGVHVPRHEGAIEHSVNLVINGNGKVQFCGSKEVLLFSLYWEKEGDDLDGGFDIFDDTGLAHSIEFFK
jgi:hypothetical protein